ncbi:MAG: hypothetical protein KF901_10550 [Myxococcales bacterium]|nr:hypothetical protein [Myxococcales bacterium]
MSSTDPWIAIGPALGPAATFGAIVTLALTAGVVARAASTRSARWWGLLGAMLSLLLAILAARRRSTSSVDALGADALGADALGMDALWGLDALSAPIFPFVVALFAVITLAAPTRFASPTLLARLALASALALVVIGARHPLLVALAWAGSSVPTAIELRGRPGARAFVVHHVVSALFVVAGLFAAHVASPRLAGALLVLGVLIREGVVPFHAWVPSLYERAPLGSALLFSRAQVGAYLLARVLVASPLGSSATWGLDLLGAMTMLYGAALALGQPGVRRALGYLATSQTAIVLLGLADGGPIGARGAVLAIVSVGLAQTGLGLALWVTEARRGELRLDGAGEGVAATPALAGATLFLGLACVGLPGTLAFVAEELVFHATLEARPWIGVAMVTATAINGVLVLRIALRIFAGGVIGGAFGARRPRGGADLLARERVAFGLLGASLVTFGVAPQRLLSVGAEDPAEIRADVHVSADMSRDAHRREIHDDR